MPALLVSVRFHDGRYHGQPDWPPSPARLFQALVAAAARGGSLDEADKSALAWLETLQPPVIGAPPKRSGQGFRNFVPNNDLDSVGGDLKRIGEIRTPKRICPVLFDAETPLLYVWPFDPGHKAQAERICAIADEIYQLGRGVDMAWAWGEILDDADPRLATYEGATHRPCASGAGTTLDVPFQGSLESLIARHAKMRARFQTVYEARPAKGQPDRKVAVGQVFAQPPKPRFGRVVYDSPPVRIVFELRKADGETWAWPLEHVVSLVERVRDRAADHAKTLGGDDAVVERVFIGRGALAADKTQRLRILPLPSIGHVHADRGIRRVLVEIPANCPMPARQIETAFLALDTSDVDAETGEILSEGPTLVATAFAENMLSHYGLGNAGGRIWRTVTPAALPVARRRIDPMRRREYAKAGSERADEESKAASATIQALRHAGVAAHPRSVRVQREPFEANGARAEAFAPGTRFPKERLWHVEIEFDAPQSGPVVLGDGRFLGLGLMAPVVDEPPNAIIFAVDAGTVPVERTYAILRALRRAVMSRVGARLPRGESLPFMFHGHEPDNSRARNGGHDHLFYAAWSMGGAQIERLAVIAPQIADRSPRTGAQRKALSRQLQRLAAALEDLREVRAGDDGLLRLVRIREVQAEPPLGHGRVWTSASPYYPTRHPKADAAATIEADIAGECARRGLPSPRVWVLSIVEGPRGGVRAHARLEFAIAVRGPILLGRKSHFGSGLFVPLD
jgi:CRISPR-associated protein Csb2